MFILTRAFAVTALLVGAASTTLAAPIPYFGFCWYGCMFKDPTATDSISAALPVSTAAAKIIQVIDVLTPTVPSADAVVNLINATPSASVETPESTPSVKTVKIIELEVPTDATDDDSSPLGDLIDVILPKLSSREYDPEAFLSGDA
ncbi:hypothetical protein NLI96_g3456 [Meripilus lineatus]|uniref:Uncharacterized protein n=1 Tax=Meripilus lineatus TaxID=2056292 RepID=A0AAD5YJ28_9APHY|nr:hypothetical protein NLI96_g3456 [Physisporinus lineatus]